ncbi:MAG TPA: hypothetical protein VHB51_00805 [Candidatus Saccharimonadales bacterium]|nr:hypothetical protein [Candidatus Saccharimonadales bacterium]
MKRRFLSLAIALSVAFAGVGSTSVVYAASALQQDACQGLSQIDSSTDCGSGGKSVGTVAGTVVNILSLITGIISVIMVIVAGLKYITAAGDSNKAATAKTTLIYALIGIAITVAAQFLVHFVINSTSSAAGTG